MWNEEITARSRAVMEQLQPGMTDKLNNYLGEFDPSLFPLITDYAFGSIIAREGLDLKTREMITIASLISLGNAQPQLEIHMHAALNVGVSWKELLEVIIQMAVYSGIPACMNGLAVFRKVTMSAFTDTNLEGKSNERSGDNRNKKNGDGKCSWCADQPASDGIRYDDNAT